MEKEYQKVIDKAYNAFNTRNIDEALTVMHTQVQWPKAFEGGYVTGHEAIREYWTRQWNEINPTVTPTHLNRRADGALEVSVQQLVKDLEGKIVFDGTVKHIYTFEDGLIKKMDVEV